LRRTYGIDPAEPNDEQWLGLYAEYKYTEQIRYENTVAAFEEALAKVISRLFPGEE
jgi:hypothetical protein